MAIKVEIIKQLSDNYAYVIYSENNKDALVLDPSEPKPIFNFLNSKDLNLNGILITHHHSDHTQGIEEIKEKLNIKVYSPNINIKGTTDILSDKQKIQFSFIDFEVISTPGHTLDHVVFFSSKEKLLFSGDTLFYYGCGRVFEGTYMQMLNSLNKLKKFPNDTKVYCGHEYTKSNLDFCLKYDPKNFFLKEKILKIETELKNSRPTVPTTIREEIKTNIFLRCDDPIIKNSLNLNNSSEDEVFSRLRDLKDNF